ncbi:Lipid A biosynthesis lauroyl acyltransferase [hydrothermal vent metagenome]|uniref:Lipid A biosynthesis lauroyl acyltransferase n=1 Tax=hydrothermal vent metagenome TaxID=652676 RepID=A0A3B1BV95_9ZZZZ
MSQKTTFPIKKFLAPRYWPTWLGLGILRLCSFLPLPILHAFGNVLGTLIYYLPISQRRIALINIHLCFPELTPKQQHQRVRANLRSVAIALFESSLAWWASNARLKTLHRIEGLEHLRRAQTTGKGILLLGGHYTTLELGGRLISRYVHGVGIYKPAHNKLFEAVMAHTRKKTFADLIPSKNMRKIIRALKQGKTCWYAPDQDFGRQGTVFAPFMGVPAASLTISARIAQLSGAIVLPFSSRRLPGNQGYAITLQEPLENFPSGDDLADATRVNQAIEEGVRLAPEQYLWVHRRFKTRPFAQPQLYPLRRDKRLRRYSQLLALLTLPALLYTRWMAWQCKDKYYLPQRLGLSIKPQNKPLIWIHAASVGEVNAVLPLVKLMLEKNPALNIYLTTTTPTGQVTAQDKMPNAVTCGYLPLDLWWSVRHFLQAIKPACALIVETEIWPNLFEACFQYGVPLTVINGRLSARTLNTRPWIRALYCKAMENTHAVLARSKEDAQGFVSLSVAEERVKVIGNIKYSASTENRCPPIQLDRPYVLAASTRESEETMIARQWLAHRQNNYLLVIVPRHPKRLNEMVQDLSSFSAKIAIRSKNESITAETQIYIADTFGELPGFIAGSEFVIMGGGFANKGGQNILEVAQQGKAVIFGNHMDNFRDEVQLFLQQQAGVCAGDEQALGVLIQEWMENAEIPRQIGENAHKLSRENSKIAQHYLQEISELYPQLFPS